MKRALLGALFSFATGIYINAAQEHVNGKEHLVVKAIAPTILSVTGSDDQVRTQIDDALNTHTYTIVLFHSAHCFACKRFMQDLLAIANEFPEVAFVTLEVSKYKKIAQEYGVRGGVPYFIYYLWTANGPSEKGRSVGYISQKNFISQLQGKLKVRAADRGLLKLFQFKTVFTENHCK